MGIYGGYSKKSFWCIKSQPCSYYCKVFDGHGGKHAADFACNHLPRFIAEDEDFPRQIDRAISAAFLQTDTAFAEACTLDADLASGTTALAALVIGRFTCSPLKRKLIICCAV